MNQRRQSLMLVALTIVIVLGALPTAFAQKNLNAKYPKPDFSALEEYFEVVSYEFDYTSSQSAVPQMFVVAKKKQDKVLRRWDVNWYDADGVKIIPTTPLWFDTANNAKVGEPVRASAFAPFKDKMAKVKRIVVTESDAN
jgi:hypothetical protein